MRPFEIQLGVALAVSALATLFLRAKGNPALGMGILLAGLGLCHLLLEGFRLQAIPLYVGIPLVLCLLYFDVSGLPRLLIVLTTLVIVGGGLVLCYALPVFELPAPTGPLRIGTTTLYLTDEARVEIHSTAARRPRKFVAQIWYPANDCAGYPQATYRDLAALSVRSLHMRYVKTHACVEAPVLKGENKWPIVFFSPSSGGYRSQNSYLIEDLVSHGYVAVGLDHPYSSSRVVFPDGSVIYSLPNDWLQLGTREKLDQSIPIVEATLQTRAGDMEFIHNLLREQKVDGIALAVARQVDFGAVGALGHSFGGGAAAEVCRRNPSFKAGVNFDGWMFQGVREEGVPKPFLFAIEDDPLWLKNDGPFGEDEIGLTNRGTKDYHDMIRRSVARWGGYILRPTGVFHGGFADMCLYTRWPAPGYCPGVEAGHRLVRNFTLAYFNKHLKNQRPALLEASATTSEYELIAGKN